MAAQGRTSLSEDEFIGALAKVTRHLRDQEHINNRAFRALTGLNYDQAIKFFNLAVERGALLRKGRASGIHYVRPREAE